MVIGGGEFRKPFQACGLVGLYRVVYVDFNRKRY